MGQLRIRTADARDIPVIQAIAHATWPVAYAAILSREQLKYMLDRMYSGPALLDQLATPDHHALIVESEEGPVAFCVHCHHHRGGRSTRIHKLYVIPSAQGYGAGSALLKAVEQQAIMAGDHRIELNVNRYNPAKDFYLKHGFRITRDEVIDIGKGFVMDDHVMERSLKISDA